MLYYCLIHKGSNKYFTKRFIISENLNQILFINLFIISENLNIIVQIDLFIRYYKLMSNQPLTLVYSRLCPFAHRAWITVLQKEVPFKKLEVSLTEKSTQFTQIYQKAYGRDPNSNGKVPILIHGNTVITQSDLVAWYVAEQFDSGSSLIPKDSFQRVKLRWFIQQVVSKVVPTFYSAQNYRKKNEEQKKQVYANIRQTLQKLEDNIVGPYVLGEQFTLADIFVYPWLERWSVLQTLFGLSIPKQFTKIHVLRESIQKRPSVKTTNAQTSEKFYIQALGPIFGVKNE